MYECFVVGVFGLFEGCFDGIKIMVGLFRSIVFLFIGNLFGVMICLVDGFGCLKYFGYLWGDVY